ncbi:hypothetical protein IBB56_08415 [Listeria welshimeri]|uniref:hypothetical protein n=1 Tax=Listeria welshimeri TaxID=1643 RepID=UPI001625F3B2|nr:hypothetical protein [Listeria welshimeri]MBC1340267.1 hypothetical protein [Listeria welshimeri]MBC1344004.1 hypothetical protein [Listeria welshimeri]MBC1345829.1 hypothetical protein [Listeria welshimeri]MBC1349146.1 hypothetical protein [Listeria welshimeri]MBC1363738.1 hypothetical protein [Listeria welshimeri]
MRKIPIFTLLAAILLFGGYYLYQHASSKVDVTFNFVVEQKDKNNTITGKIDGAGNKSITLPLSKESWDKVKKGNRYNVEATFYNKKKISSSEAKELDGPFWSNDSNQGLLVNKVQVENIQELSDDF